MAFPKGPPTDPAISVHLLEGDTARLRALASRDGTSVAGLLRQVVHGYLVGHPPDDGIDALAERLGADR